MDTGDFFSEWTSVTAPSVFPLSSKFTLEYLLCEDDLDSESISPCSGLRPSSVRSGHWRPSLPGPRVAVDCFLLLLLHNVRPAIHVQGVQILGELVALGLARRPPPCVPHHHQTTSTPVCALPTDGTAVCLLTSLCIPTCWPHAWWAFLSSGLLRSTLSPRLDTRSSTASPGGGSCSVTFCRLDSCSPAASSSSELPRASCSVPLAAGLHHQPAAPSASQGQMSSSSSSDSLTSPRTAALTSPRTSGSQPWSWAHPQVVHLSPGGHVRSLQPLLLFPLEFSLTLPSQGPLPVDPRLVSLYLSLSLFRIPCGLFPCWVMPDCRLLKLSTGDA